MFKKFVTLLLISVICFSQMEAKDKSTKKKQNKNSTKKEEVVNLEIALGRAIAAYYSKKYKILRHADSTSFINSLGYEMVMISNTKDFAFFFGILDTEEDVFMPIMGGYILVSKGLLRKAKTESQLALLLAKAIASINIGHELKKTKSSIEYFGVSFSKSDLVDEKFSDSSKIKQVENAAAKGFSEKDSLESETAGLILISSVGYNVQESIDLADAIYSKEFASKRKKELSAFIKANELSSGKAGNLKGFQAFQESLKNKDDDIDNIINEKK